MSATHITSTDRIVVNRLVWVTPVAIAAATAANLIVFLTADALFGVAWEPGFNAAGVIAGTVVYLLMAGGVFALVARRARNPVKVYWIIAVVALFLSFSMPVMALFGIPTPAGQRNVYPPDSVVVMIITHILAFAVSTPIFTRLSRGS